MKGENVMKIKDFSVEINYIFKSLLICLFAFFVFILVGSTIVQLFGSM